MSYFENLGRTVAADLATASGRYGSDPATRERLRSVADGVFDQHFADPGLAQDAMPDHNMERNHDMAYAPQRLPPRGGGYKALDQEDPDLDTPSGGGMMDAQSAFQTIQDVLDNVDPNARAQLIARLREYCDAGTGSSGAADAAARTRRRMAMDTRATARVQRQRSFRERFPDAANIEVWNGGGY
jgi:hypothetical protein